MQLKQLNTRARHGSSSQRRCSAPVPRCGVRFCTASRGRTIASAAQTIISTPATPVQPSSSSSSSSKEEGPAPDARVEPQASGQVDWFDAWYPIAFEADVDRTAPYRFVLMEIPLVVWWDPNTSAWRVHEDLCPHRLVPLSEGRINKKGNLECGYHGWEFSATGKCERIPQGGNEGAARACVAAFPCALRQGLLWVKPIRLPNPVEAGSDAALAAAAKAAQDAAERIPIVPELEEDGWLSQDTWRDLPMDYSTLLENVLDSSHVPFTHHKSMSNRNQIGDFQIKLTSPVKKDGFNGFWATGPRAGDLGAQSTEFAGPHYVKHSLDASDKRGFKALTVVYGVPTSPGRCRLINRNCTKFVKSGLPGLLMKALPPWVPHVSSHVLLEDDQIFLHLGELEYTKRRAQGASVTGAYFLASPADTLVGAYRAWLDRHGGGGPFGKPDEALLRALGPRESRPQLLDRFSQHTAHCQTCQKGMRQVQQLGAALRGLAVAAGAAALLTVAVAVATGSGAAGAAAATAAPTFEAVRSEVGGNVVLAGASWALLSVSTWLAGPVGGGHAGAQVLRALGWALAGLVAWSASQSVDKLEGAFHQGTYPPPRNVVNDGP